MQIRFYHEWHESKNHSTVNPAQISRRLSLRISDKKRTVLLIIACLVSSVILIFGIADNADNLSGQALQQETAKSSSILYTIKQGDTLWAIAIKYYPDKKPAEALQEIKEANALSSEMIQIGQTLRLP
jgi:LysM repeat protein